MTQNVTLLLYIMIHILWSFAIVCWNNRTDVPWGMYIMLQQWMWWPLSNWSVPWCSVSVMAFFFLTVPDIDKNVHFPIATKYRCERVKGSTCFPRVVWGNRGQNMLIPGIIADLPFSVCKRLWTAVTESYSICEHSWLSPEVRMRRFLELLFVC